MKYVLSDPFFIGVQLVDEQCRKSQLNYIITL